MKLDKFIKIILTITLPSLFIVTFFWINSLAKIESQQKAIESQIKKLELIDSYKIYIDHLEELNIVQKKQTLAYFNMAWQLGSLAGVKSCLYEIDLKKEYSQDSIKAFPGSVVHFSSD